MESISITATFTVYPSVASLPQEVQVLMEAAVNARKVSYAPYSKFHVGAALLLDNGTTVIGSNQENAAYPSGLCAERVA
ncbi:MAG: cytidine deaminase, partial [Bacteroidota bacterium]